MIPGNEFDLLIEKVGDGYRARVRDDSGGGGVERLRLPLDAAELERLLADLFAPRRLRRVEPPDRRAARRLGQQLFRAVFRGEIRDRFVASRERARHSAGKRLRLRLRLAGDARLSRIPWELLYDPGIDEFIAVTGEIDLVRSLDGVHTVPRAALTPPLRVLAAMANPRDLEPLAVEQEWRRIEQAADSLDPERLTLDRLAPATRSALEDSLRGDTIHVLHFVVHGEFDAASREGVLVLEDARGLADRVSGQELAMLLRGCRSLRLVVLNGCEGGRCSRQDVFDGLAQSLVRSGVPAVVGMQYSISDDAARDFAGGFYRRLVEGCPLDEAVTAARRSMAFSHRHTLEWATPVLYLQAPDGVLLALPEKATGGSGEQAPSAAAKAVAAAADQPQTDKPPEESPGQAKGRRLRRPWAMPAAAVIAVAALAVAVSLCREEPPEQRVPDELSSAGEPIRAARIVTSAPECPPPRGLDMPFALIPAGTFTMGGSQDGEKPRHQVTLSRPFCLGVFEVTRGAWRQVTGESTKPQRDDLLPVTDVAWDDIPGFLDGLEEREPGVRFRLPTEAEWEYAARAGTTTDFSFDGDESALSHYGNCKSDPSDGFNGLAPVGSFEPNPWGLYDMYGNAWEWVADREGQYEEDAVTDPAGALTGIKRVRRGGSWRIKAANCSSSHRASSEAGRRADDVGFRVVRELP